MEFQKEELNEILNIFQQESQEIISSMDDKLLKLEQVNQNSNIDEDCNADENNNSSNQDNLSNNTNIDYSTLAIQLFRDAHSLKGSARMLGFNDIQNLAHKIEDIISLIKENKIKPNSSITEIISECLEFILDLINKTVEQKEEYKSSLTPQYIEKLESARNNAIEESEKIDKEQEIQYSEEEKKFLDKFNEIENLIINILLIITTVRINKNYQETLNLEEYLKNLELIINDVNLDEIKNIKEKINNIQNSIDKLKQEQNKELSFLNVNVNVNSLIEAIINYVNKKRIKRRDYYEIVENKLKQSTQEIKQQVHKDSNNQQLDEKTSSQQTNNSFKNLETSKNVYKTTIVEDEKIKEVLDRISLLEVNCDFYKEILDLINLIIQEEHNNVKKEIILNIKKTIEAYKNKNATLPNDVSNGLKDILRTLSKSINNHKIKEIFIKSDIIKTMAEFKQKPQTQNHNQNNKEFSQKDILKDITNTEIKTLKVDSIKLDNLVGQIEELIVSKIKTNEQLVLAKQINNDLIEWQKNFIKMNYYIKYFDKKYLSNPLGQSHSDFRKIISYNKQLSTLTEQHTQKIAHLIKEMSNLFKQLQESEAKLNTTTTEVETMVKNMRVLPLSTIFQLFPRMVHNIAKEKNKKIDLIINGSDVAADKTIIEELKIPLMHIIRNSIDHGIEDVTTRRSLGKNPVGRIEINAIYKDNKVIVDVKDNGRGLDIEKIKAKAIEKELLTPEEINVINEEELINLIFYPGFSTEDFVTELSGRGLGLDIVNNKINQLQGRVDVYSQLNQGTIVRITLPAAIATKKVFIIQESKQLFAIETSIIKTIVRINSDDVFRKDNNNYFIYNNCAIPIYTLSQILNLESNYENKTKFTLAIIETDNFSAGIIVEKLISDQEIVHKKLAPPLYKLKFISGVTTLASGEACLVLNIGDIINTINSKKIIARISLKNNLEKPQDNSKYKILIVDDSYTTRILQKNILSNCGYDVHTASEPLSAFDKLEHTKFDVIISDVEMPNMSGFEFISKLKKIEQFKQIPIIIVSSEPKENHIHEIQKINIKAYIEKNSFKQDELISIVEKCLDGI